MNHKLYSFAIIDDDELINIIGGKTLGLTGVMVFILTETKFELIGIKHGVLLVVFHINHGQMDWPISVK